MIRTTKTETLWAELRQLGEANRLDQEATRVAEIRKELMGLARRKASSRAHRSLMYELNGHHGPA